MSEIQIVRDGCMITYTGIMFDLFNPKLEYINIADIAHALAHTCRWNGATQSYYSVAEHCCRMFDMVEDRYKPIALFHDAEEAYFGDIIKPLKNMLPANILAAMENLKYMICCNYDIKESEQTVKQLDNDMLVWEHNNIISSYNYHGWDCMTAEDEFLSRYNYLLDNKLIRVFTKDNQTL